MKAAEAARSSSATPGRRENPAVQALLEHKRGGVYGTITSLAAPKPGFEVAFETASGGSLNDLVVDTRETAIECINYLKAKRLGLLGRAVSGRVDTPPTIWRGGALFGSADGYVYCLAAAAGE